MAAAGSALAAAFSYAGIASGVAFPASLPQYGQASRSGVDETPQCEQGAASHVAQAGQRSQLESIDALQVGQAGVAVDSPSARISPSARESAAVCWGRA